MVTRSPSVVMDHYSILGVSSSASKAEIKTAYRERKEALAAKDESSAKNEDARTANRLEGAALNEAWNVLSDQSQRDRYDAQIASRDSEVIEGSAIELSASVGGEPLKMSAKFAGQTPAPPNSPPPNVGGGPLSQRSRRARLALPAGVELADTRPRILAMVFDITVIILLVICTQIAGAKIISERYPVQKEANATAGEARTAAAEDLSAASKSLKAAEDKASKATGDEKASAQAEVDKREEAEKSAKKADQRAAEELKKTQEELRGPATAVLVASSILALFYLVPSTALTGRTLGKRLRGVKVLRSNGEPLTWWAAFSRYLLPVAIATALFYSPPGLLLALGSVLWWLWDPNRQGSHDRISRTIVVSAPVPRLSLGGH